MPGIDKKIMLKEMKATLEGGDIFFAKFDRVNVADFSELRRSIKNKEGRGIVVKKTLAKIALTEMGMEEATGALDGQMFLVASPSEPQIISKELVDFSKKQEGFVVNGVFMDGTFHSSEYVNDLAQLPSREQLLASVVGGIKAPITNFVMGLNSLLRSMVVVLDQVKQQKEKQS